MTAVLQELGEYLSLKRNDCVLSWSIAHDELTV
ncbi:MAG: NADH-quinone oxidoreductase subunit C, partial [Rhodobacteraceae bacterium]|nr:NADH-quinone oxidoreductase subunit C [Paracoccaceae bacterium]